MTSLTRDNPDEPSSSSAPNKSSSVSKIKEKRSVSFENAAGVTRPGTSGGGPQRKPQQQRKVPQKRVAVNNIKKENIAQLIQKKKECDKKAHEIVVRLIDPEVSREYLLENAIRISKPHMEDVIEERQLSKMCGWVLCDTQIDPKSIPKQTYSIRGHNVYDITERKCFCSGKCYAKASHFKAQLLTSPLWLRDMEENVRFQILEDEETKELHGMTVVFSSVTLSDDSEEEHDTENNGDNRNEDRIDSNR